MEASVAPVSHGPRRGLVSGRLLRVASDERLVEHIRGGSQPAFEVIYDRHHRGILSFCRHMLGSHEEAEDALQHTFMAAYRDLTASPDKAIQLKAWLYTIARNRCLTVLRARREHPSDDLDEPATEGLTAQVQQRADLQDLLRDLAALPEQQRAALVLSELGDMSHEQIAVVVDCPKDKVKALVFQARTSLQQSREARDTSCQDIREMLASLSGGSLRRTMLRRHLRECDGCRSFEAEVKRQRRAMAAVLPVVPTLGLKESALAAAFGAKTAGVGMGAGAAAAGATASGAATAAAGSGALVAKVLVVAAVATGGSVAGYQAATDDPARSGTPAAERGEGAAGDPGAPAPSGAPLLTPGSEEVAAERARDRRADGRRKGRARGKDDRGKTFAEGRGKGKKRGLRGTQPGKAQDKQERRSARRKSQLERKLERARRKVVRRQRAGARTKVRTEKRKDARKPAPPPPREPVEPKEDKPKPPPEPEPTPPPTPEPTPAPTVTPDAGAGKPRP